MNKLAVLSDPLLDDYGPSRPPLLVSIALRKKGYDITFVSPIVSKHVRELLENEGVKVVNLGKKVFSKSSSYIWLESWFKEVISGSSGKLVSKILSDSCCILNFSGTILMDSALWYLCGTVSSTVDNMVPYMPLHYKLAGRLSKPVLKWGDKKFINTMNRSKCTVAISRYCSDSYKSIGARVDTIIYPPIDLDLFKRSTENPSRDYVLSYLGKETRIDILKKLADLGIKLKLFGGKLKHSTSEFLKHDNIQLVGHVSDKELIDLYSNALFTAFAFTDEVFGYIPLESMACGTPVLSYKKQGPMESIIDNETGWLCSDDQDFLNKAAGLWKNGYSEGVSSKCVERASSFDMKFIGDQWDQLICRIQQKIILAQ